MNRQPASHQRSPGIKRGYEAGVVLFLFLIACLDREVRSADSASSPDAHVSSVSFPSEKSALIVPIRKDGSLLFGEVRINGQDAGCFLIDTGTSMNIIDSHLARTLQLPEVAGGTLEGIGGSRAMTVCEVDSLAIGGLVLDNQRIAEVDLQNLQYRAIEINGILGREFLRHFPFTIDYQSSTITFYDPRQFQAPKGGRAEKITFIRKRPSIKARLDDQFEGWLSIDTGSDSWLTLNTHVTDQYLDLLLEGPVLQFEVAGVGGTNKYIRSNLESLEIFGSRWRNVDVDFSRAKKGISADHAQLGRVGGCILEKYRLTFDYAQQNLWIEPVRRTAPKRAKSRPKRTLGTLGGVDVDDADFAGNTSLILAASDGLPDVAQVLILMGADVNARNYAGETALTLAARKGYSEIVKLLISKGADVNAETKDGYTALLYAVKEGRVEVIKALMHEGVGVGNAQVQFARQLAKLSGHAEVVQHLR